VYDIPISFVFISFLFFFGRGVTSLKVPVRGQSIQRYTLPCTPPLDERERERKRDFMLFENINSKNPNIVRLNKKRIILLLYTLKQKTKETVYTFPCSCTFIVRISKKKSLMVTSNVTIEFGTESRKEKKTKTSFG
jgi:hypothetical protein